jgi:acyl-CoA-binding protein
MDLQQQFEAAVANSKTLSVKPANEILLQLYSLYKQATAGDINVPPPENIFDIAGKAKHEAWALQQGKSPEQAMEEYVQLVNKLKAAEQ